MDTFSRVIDQHTTLVDRVVDEPVDHKIEDSRVVDQPSQQLTTSWMDSWSG
jgi:hypothetical protein